MLPKENGLFLEIADGVHRLGFSILKGCMEVQNNKIWACFVVEVVFPSVLFSLTWLVIFYSSVTLLHSHCNQSSDHIVGFQAQDSVCIVRLAVCNQNMKT
jgi:hypothetical protein